MPFIQKTHYYLRNYRCLILFIGLASSNTQLSLKRVIGLSEPERKHYSSQVAFTRPR